ncbi:hypothetical protein [Paenibacillus sp. NPDC057934]|uniref:3-dehydroquinate synthase family protein n=1 Tax=Paenibacillus sp. NPDC057934 TaxID=3346282 RepID=UPI0036DEC402
MIDITTEKKSKYIDFHLQDKVRAYYEYDIADQFADVLNEYSFDKVFFISEQVIFDIHGHEFLKALQKKNVLHKVLLIGSSEKDKSFSNLEFLCNYLIEHQISKDSIIISFGGGVVGNIVGLAAGLIYRGVRYIEIPTTFMGQTDSTLSNKQAINGASGKNQIGRYYAPLFVWSDLKYLETESPRNIKAAIVEGVKNTFIQDIDLLEELASFIKGKTAFSAKDLYYLFETIAESKNKILEKDPSEKGYAVILEYGHTFGHAIEFLTSGEIIHGEAVAIGMCIAAEISFRLGKLRYEDVKLHYEILYHLIFKDNPVLSLLNGINAESILKCIECDNKRTSSGVKYVILERMGECCNIQGDCQIPVEKSVVVASIEEAFSKIKNSLVQQVWRTAMEEYRNKKEKDTDSILNEYFEGEYDKQIFDSTSLGHIALYLGDYHTEEFNDQLRDYLESIVHYELSGFDYGPSYIAPKQYGTPGWWYSLRLLEDNQELELFTCRSIGEWNKYSEEVKKSLMSHYAVAIDTLEQFDSIVEYMLTQQSIEMIMMTRGDRLGHTYAHFHNLNNNLVLEIIHSTSMHEKAAEYE